MRIARIMAVAGPSCCHGLVRFDNGHRVHSLIALWHHKPGTAMRNAGPSHLACNRVISQAISFCRSR